MILIAYFEALLLKLTKTEYILKLYICYLINYNDRKNTLKVEI